MNMPRIVSRTTLAMAAAVPLALAACADADEVEEETTYEVDAVDQSGGELIVADPDAQGVPVTLPETEMTNVPPGERSDPLPPGDEMPGTVPPPAQE